MEWYRKVTVWKGSPSINTPNHFSGIPSLFCLLALLIEGFREAFQCSLVLVTLLGLPKAGLLFTTAGLGCCFSIMACVVAKHHISLVSALEMLLLIHTSSSEEILSATSTCCGLWRCWSSSMVRSVLWSVTNSSISSSLTSNPKDFPRGTLSFTTDVYSKPFKVSGWNTIWPVSSQKTSLLWEKHTPMLYWWVLSSEGCCNDPSRSL